MDNGSQIVDNINMPSDMVSSRWLTARSLHQVQILSCDVSDFEKWDCTDHCSPFWRLFWHEGEGAVINLAGREVPLPARRLIVILPNTHFSSRLTKPVRQFFLHFLVEPHYRGSADAVFQLNPSPWQEDLCAGIVARLLADASDIRASFEGQMLAASALLALPVDGWTRRYEDARVSRAVESLAEGYPAWPGNELLARRAGMHPTSFIRLFRRATGHTPLQHLVNLRLEEACSMLHFDDATLDEIAERCGFGERGYFTRVFSRNMNCSPARYRRLVNVSSRLRPTGD
jgi:AraC-like DNA-binding protein